MSDVGGLGRIPNGIERVNRSQASRDESRRSRKNKKDEEKQDPKSATESKPKPDPESQEDTGAVVDVLDDTSEGRSAAAEEDQDDLENEDRGRHLDTRA